MWGKWSQSLLPVRRFVLLSVHIELEYFLPFVCDTFFIKLLPRVSEYLCRMFIQGTHYVVWFGLLGISFPGRLSFN